MIGIVNYGVGNVRAFANIYERLGLPARIASTPEDLRAATHLILPGVGAFDWTMTHLNRSGLRDALNERVINDKRPVLGVCVGMQMLAHRSDEGELPGLGWLDAQVKKFDVSTFSQRTRIPHMGWNNVALQSPRGLFEGFGDDSRFYFLHSYYFAPADPADILASTDYNGQFASVVGRGNIFGVQFHPEKSHQWGVKLLENFARL